MRSFSVIMVVFVFVIVSMSFSQYALADEAHPWDVNGDGVVDIADVILVGSHFGDSSAIEVDVNGDGSVNIADLILVGVHFGEEYGADKITVNVAADSGETLELKDGAVVDVPPMAMSQSTTISIEALAEMPAEIQTTPGEQLLGKVYEITAGDVVLNEPVVIRLPYDPALVPPGAAENDLSIAYWEEGQWVALESYVDTDSYEITAQVDHLSIFSPIFREKPEISLYADPEEYTYANFQDHTFVEDLTFRAEIGGQLEIKRVTIQINVHRRAAWNEASINEISPAFSHAIPASLLSPVNTKLSTPLIRMMYEDGFYTYVCKLKDVRDNRNWIVWFDARVTVTTIAGGVADSEIVIIPIRREYLPEIILSSPESGEVVSPTPTFEWKTEGMFPLDEHIKLEVVVDNDSKVWWFPNPGIFELDNPYIKEFSLPADYTLSPGKTYYWNVRYKDTLFRYGKAQAPVPYEFKVRSSTPPEITLQKPANNKAVDDTTPTFVWTSSNPEGDEIHHGLYVDDDIEVFSNPAFYKIVGTGTAFEYAEELPPGTYYWGVKAFNMDSGEVIPGTEASSDVWSFTVASPTLDVSVAFLNFLPGENTKTFQIRNSGGGTLGWRIGLIPEWLIISPTEGENDEVISATVDRSQIPSGTGKEDYLIITAGSQTKEIAVTVEVVMPGVNEIIGPDSVPMVLIPAGEFMMGDAFNEGDSNELPVHTVYLDAFYIDKYEVTNAQYAQFLNEYGKTTDPVGHTLIYIDNDWCKIVKDGDTYRSMASYENHPVVRVSWYGAAAYAQFYGKRLPTEAEWERAARGTFIGEGKYKKYVWGNEWPPPEGAGNFYSQRIDGYDDAYEQTAPVGSFDPNGYGLHDMAGNVWEWCADAYIGNYYNISERNNPKGPGAPVTFRNDDFANVNSTGVLRGGCWYLSNWDSLRVAYRYFRNPTISRSYIGFRCVSQD